MQLLLVLKGPLEEGKGEEGGRGAPNNEGSTMQNHMFSAIPVPSE